MRDSLLESIHADVRSLCLSAIKKSFGPTTISKKLFDAISIEQPPDEKLGDFAFPVFTLAKELKKSPTDIAHTLTDVIKKLPPEISAVHAAGPYVNFFLDPSTIGNDILKEKKLAVKKKKNGRIIIEYVSPNTNKPLHIGHARNAFLGESMARIYEHLGHDMVRACLVNDRGIHICKSMVAYQENSRFKIQDSRFPTPSSVGQKGDHFVGDFYVLYEKLLKENPAMETRAKECLQQWETGDKKTRALWKKMNGWVFNGMAATYKRLGISFDITYMESEMYTQGKDIILKGLSKGVFKKDETGAVYADLSSFNLPNKILLRKDGTAIYITQDIYLAFKKWKDYKPAASLYVVASEQDLYFKQFFSVLTLLGIPYADHLTHVSYGMVRLPEGKMKSREGTVVDADDLINELVGMVREEIKKRDTTISKKEANMRSEAIALAALKFFLLIVGPSSDMTFNPKESISLHGRTGPYLLYTYARLKSIARKAKKLKGNSRRSKVERYDFADEKKLVLLLMRFEETIQRSADSSNPSLLANYLYELSQATNDYYHATPVLKSIEPARTARLLLIAKIADILKEGLHLLGIKTIEKM